MKTNQEYKNAALAALSGNWAPAVVASVVMMLIVVAMSIAEALLNDTPDVATAKLNFVYMGIYITLLISGGGRYAFNVPNLLRKNGPKG